MVMRHHDRNSSVPAINVVDFQRGNMSKTKRKSAMMQDNATLPSVLSPGALSKSRKANASVEQYHSRNRPDLYESNGHLMATANMDGSAAGFLR